jgi:hypothetical protein
MESYRRLLLVLAVELRPEETGRSLHNFVGPLQFSDFLLKIPDPLRLPVDTPGAYPSSMSAWRTQERTDSTP